LCSIKAGEALKIEIVYKKRKNLHQCFLTLYLWNRFEIFSYKIDTDLWADLGKMHMEDDVSIFSPKTYINIKNKLKIIKDSIAKMQRHLIIRTIELDAEVGTNNPAATALICGLLQFIIGNTICVFSQKVPIKTYNIRILPNFNGFHNDIFFSCTLKSNFIYAVKCYFSLKKQLTKGDVYESTTSN
jgi:hypothetical protein